MAETDPQVLTETERTGGHAETVTVRCRTRFKERARGSEHIAQSTKVPVKKTAKKKQKTKNQGLTKGKFVIKSLWVLFKNLNF